MSVRIGQARTNKKAEVQGVWVNFALYEGERYVYWLDGEVSPIEEGESSARMKIARAGNPKWKTYREQAMEPYQRIIEQLGKLPMKIAEQIVREASAHTILLDWEGVSTNEEGTPTPFSPDAAIDLFERDPEFLDFVLKTAQTFQLFRDRKMVKEGEDLGNSSSGNSSGEDMSRSSSTPELTSSKRRSSKALPE